MWVMTGKRGETAAVTSMFSVANNRRDPQLPVQHKAYDENDDLGFDSKCFWEYSHLVPWTGCIHCSPVVCYLALKIEYSLNNHLTS
jgi:hypothetical protein